MVRLEAWNCSCAAFAFACFPGGGSASSWRPESCTSDFELNEDLGEEQIRTARVEDEGRGEKWEFGGRSHDGRDGNGAGVPCCKHLLACLLGTKWEGVLGAYVKERVVGREEMAGLGGEN